MLFKETRWVVGLIWGLVGDKGSVTKKLNLSSDPHCTTYVALSKSLVTLGFCKMTRFEIKVSLNIYEYEIGVA